MATATRTSEVRSTAAAIALDRCGAVCAICLAALLSGCHDQTRYSVIRTAQSPSGSLNAFLIQNSNDTAMSSSTYYVVLSSTADGTAPELHRRHLPWEDTAFYATNGSGIQLHWADPKNLELVCDRCGIRTIDIEEKKYQSKSVAISYKGFPKT